MKVFVSYSTRDMENVSALQASLANTSIEAFVAENSVKPSGNLPQEITRAIERCNVFVLIWSKNAKESEWVSQEIGQAVSKKKKIIPIVLGGSMGLPGFIRELKYINAEGRQSEAMAEVRELLEAEYKKIKKAQADKEKSDGDRNFMVGAGIGALLLWAFSK